MIQSTQSIVVFIRILWSSLIIFLVLCCSSPSHTSHIDSWADSSADSPDADAASWADFSADSSDADAASWVDSPTDLAPMDEAVENDALPDVPADTPYSEDDLAGPDLDGTNPDASADGSELADSADSFDPSSCKAWQPDLIKDFPRLYPPKEEFDNLKMKLQNPEGLYQSYFMEIKNIADWSEETMGDIFDPYISQHNALLANFAIFYGILSDDPIYVEKGKTALTNIRSHFDTITIVNPLVDKIAISCSEAMIHYLQGYDLLKTFERFENDEEAVIRSTLLTYIENYYQVMYFQSQSLVLQFAKNNHAIKSAAALGVAAFVFNEHENACKWINQAMTDIYYYLFLFQAVEEGGIAEGPGYYLYTMPNTQAFFRVYHRYFPGSTLPYKNQWNIRAPDTYMSEDIVEIEDFAEMDRLKQIHDWIFAITLPNGLVPNIDDSGMGLIPGGHLGHFHNDGKFIWNWNKPAVNHPHFTSLDDADQMLFILDKLPEEKAPEGDASRIFYEAGQGIIKTGFSEDDSFLLVMGEHGQARINGLGHEQADESSFIFYAKNTLQLIDSGYIHFTEKEKVAKPENHNLILVDGQGAPYNLIGFGESGADAYLGEHFKDTLCEGTEVTTYYRMSDFHRRYFLCDMRLLVVDDAVASDSEHTYSVLAHGNGGGSTGRFFEQTSSGAKWSDDAQGLYGVLLGEEGILTLTHYDDYHSFWGEVSTHTVLKGDIVAKATDILEVYFVTENKTPEISWDATSSYRFVRVKDGDIIYYIIQNPASGPQTVIIDGIAFELVKRITIVRKTSDGDIRSEY